MKLYWLEKPHNIAAQQHVYQYYKMMRTERFDEIKSEGKKNLVRTFIVWLWLELEIGI